jgi:hypothetical protein
MLGSIPLKSRMNQFVSCKEPGETASPTGFFGPAALVSFCVRHLAVQLTNQRLLAIAVPESDSVSLFSAVDQLGAGLPWLPSRLRLRLAAEKAHYLLLPSVPVQDLS